MKISKYPKKKYHRFVKAFDLFSEASIKHFRKLGIEIDASASPADFMTGYNVYVKVANLKELDKKLDRFTDAAIKIVEKHDYSLYAFGTRDEGANYINFYIVKEPLATVPAEKIVKEILKTMVSVKPVLLKIEQISEDQL